MRGFLIAFEGLDQSGKQTQAEGVRTEVVGRGRECRLFSFPDYTTPIGAEIGEALQGSRDYGADVMQLMYVANRHERRVGMMRLLEDGAVVVCDRYLASSIAYGEAQGLDAVWLRDIQRFLPRPDLTILLDIAPETAVRRKAAGRDRYERDLQLLSRVRESYRRQAAQPDWLRLDGERPRAEVSADVISAIATRLAPP
ncbi:MAG: dTMP kinase [Acidobacteriota bacterium]|nr:dTMP kinase [Acidobacteriota bacterium]